MYIRSKSMDVSKFRRLPIVIHLNKLSVQRAVVLKHKNRLEYRWIKDKVHTINLKCSYLTCMAAWTYMYYVYLSICRYVELMWS